MNFNEAYITRMRELQNKAEELIKKSEMKPINTTLDADPARYWDSSDTAEHYRVDFRGQKAYITIHDLINRFIIQLEYDLVTERLISANQESF